MKSGSDWGRNELMSFNITVTTILPEQFFRQGANLSLTGLDLALITAPLDATNVSDDTYHFLSYLDLTTNTSQKTAIDDFTHKLLCIVGFEECGFILCTHHTISLSICGDNNKVTQRYVCLLDQQSTILLVLQEDKTIFNPSDPEPQVVAEAITAYQFNNQKRQ
jgi:hypothetical protein